MINNRALFCMILLAGSGTLLAADATPPPALRYDPFEQPGFLGTPGDTRTSSGPVADAGPNMELRSILESGSESVVNLNGQIMMIGDSFKGYQLVDVGKQSATFIKDGAKIKLGLRP